MLWVHNVSQPCKYRCIRYRYHSHHKCIQYENGTVQILYHSHAKFYDVFITYHSQINLFSIGMVLHRSCTTPMLNTSSIVNRSCTITILIAFGMGMGLDLHTVQLKNLAYLGYQRFFQLHLIGAKMRGQKRHILFMNKQASQLFCGNSARLCSRIIPGYIFSHENM